MLFLIGYLGIRQKPVNPTFELAIKNQDSESLDLNNPIQKIIVQKLELEFTTKIIYLNPQLNISDVVEVLGANRIYLSTIINQQYNQDFCSFLNSFRLEELERVFTEQPSTSNEQLAEESGFGTSNSMKCVIAKQAGKAISEWKQSVSLRFQL